MKFDVNQLRYLSKDDFRVLQAVELGQRNHELVPVPLIDSIAGLKHGGTKKCLSTLLKSKLVHHDNAKYDSYRLTPLGYDYLAIKTFVNRGVISGVGRQIGVGKEADVFEVTNEDGEAMALKLHRLGRTSFRAVKAKRDYLKHRSSFSWLYLSRLAALKEYAFLAALGQHGFPVPRAIDNNRHAVLMELVDAYPLVQVRELRNPGPVYQQAMQLMARLAAKGLIHCDFNEFNLLIDEEERLTLIDFPQMVSVGHGNARELFHRDVECVIRFFKKKLGYIPEHDPELPYVRPDFERILAELQEDLGPELKASGFEREHQLTLEQWAAQQPARDSDAESGTESGDESGDEPRRSDGRQAGAAEDGSEDAAQPLAGEARAAEAAEQDSGREPSSAEADRAEQPAEAAEGEAGGESDSDGSSSGGGDAATQASSLAGGRQLPSGREVQERLVSEGRRARQAARLRSAVRNAGKGGQKKGRRRGAADF